MPRRRPLARRLLPLLTPAIVLAGLGCGDDATAPTAPTGPGAPSPVSAAVAGTLAFRQISAGYTVTCGVTIDDLAYCWGTGWLGDGGPYVSRSRPVAVTGGFRYRQVSVGVVHVCAVTTDFRGYCWGSDDFGQLGDGPGSSVTRNVPVPVAGGLSIRQIRAGGAHTCAVTTNDVAYCWGAGGALGDGTSTPRPGPVPVAGGLRFRQVFAGAFHNCGATTDDRGYCWGSNTEGQLGNGRFGHRKASLVPVAVAGGLRFRQVIAGSSHTCGLTRDDTAYCWGLNAGGQLGDGSTARRTQPAAVAGGRTFGVVSPGGQHTCAITLAGKAFCWGYNSEGRLGDGTTTDRSKPKAVVGGLAFGSVSASPRSSTCGVTTGNRAYCWGDDSSDQLGNGPTVGGTLRPGAVLGP